MPFPLIALGIGSLVTAAAGITNVVLNEKNKKKAQQLQVEQHQAIVVREKERMETQAMMETARLICQKVQHEENLATQAQLAELSRDFQRYENAQNRELQRSQQQEALAFQKDQKDLDRTWQTQLAESSLSFQEKENALQRDLQVRLMELNQEFQSQQGELSRSFTEKIEVFKADMQKYFFEKQKELQIQLKAQDIDLARELRQYDRQTAIDVIHEQKREKNSAIWLVAEDLLKRGMYGDILPLNVFVSPPVILHDDSKKTTSTNGFPEMEQYLKEELRQFFQQYQAHNRQIDYLAGAWTSKQFNSEAAARQIFLGLQSEPTLILESTLEGENLSISYAYWGLGDVKQRYDTCMRFSWLEVLYGFVKERTENWFRNRAEDGTSEAEWIADYGEEFVAKYQANQAVIKREQMWLNRGEDIRELPRNYHIAPKDWDQLKRFVALCHIMIAGWVTDEYFLLNTSPDRHLSPLLPELLPGLLSGMSEEVKRQFIDPSVQIYQALYEALIRQVPDWEPELRSELAASLIKLPSKDAGIHQVNASLKVWLSYRGIDWYPSTPVIPLLAEVAKPEDELYFNSLYQVWELLGITDRVDMGNAYYRRGEDFYKRRDFEAACQDYERAISLGYVKAAGRWEIVVQVQESIKDEKIKLLREQEEKRLSQLITSKADFRKLDQLLAQRNWKDADKETGKLMCTIMGRKKEGCLIHDDDVINFPREELRILDDLWVKYSQGRFGFSVQKQVWIDCGGTPAVYDGTVAEKFGNKVGWRKNGSWVSYYSLIFNRNAPPAHLPLGVRRGVFRKWKGCTDDEGYRFEGSLCVVIHLASRL